MEIFSTYLGGPFMSGMFNVLLDRLTPENLMESLLGEDSTDAVAQLRLSMKRVRDLIDKEEGSKDMTKSYVMEWLSEVKQALYDAEDLIDEIHIESLRRKMKSEKETKSSSPADWSHLLSTVSANFNELGDQVMKQISGQGIKSKIRKVHQVLEHGCSACKLPQDVLSSRPSSTSLVDESMIYGRTLERENIITLLQEGVVDNDGQASRGDLMKGKKSYEKSIIPVIAVVGMPGIGKTTLAQQVYNDRRVDDIFPLKSWISVTDLFDNVQMIRSILNDLPDEPLDHKDRLASFRNQNDLDQEQKNLRRRLAGLRILIVFDDVWDHESLNNATWNLLLTVLKKDGAPGCAIIVTTRNEDIAKRLRPTSIIQLHELPNEDGFALFKEHAFDDPHSSRDEKLEAMGKIIVAKCRGLPLAIKVIAGYLRSVPDIKWESIASNKMWELPNDKKEQIRPALLLSYMYLSPPLRRCFAYCSIFPKNYLFEKEKLVLLWMAEGFIEQSKNDNRRIEDIGYTYFNGLLARSFFQESSTSRKYFVMHDLIHDLAVYVMEGLSFMMNSDISHAVMGSPRHFSFVRSSYDSVENFGLTSHLRTFLPVVTTTSSSQPCYYLSHRSLQSLHLFCRLRVLSLCGYKITSIPPSIGSLKHLRYLDFSSTFIKELPESICDLLNLQTLLLSHCQQLTMLPKMMKKLVHLRHLDIRDTRQLLEMPVDIGTLSCLQTLTDFVVGEDCGIHIRELGNLVQLRGSLRISGLENIDDEAHAQAAKLSDKEQLDELVLVQLDDCIDNAMQRERILSSLKPHTNLRRLALHFYEGERFPDWFGDEAFCHMDILNLEKCPSCVTLPSLGKLPSLKHLLIKDFDALEDASAQFYGQQSASLSPFRSLVTLKFQGLPQWEEWAFYEGNVEPFPCLQELRLWDCKELKGYLPQVLPSLVLLDIKNCQKLVGSLPDSPLLRELNLEDFGKIDLSSFSRLTRLTNLSLIGGKQVECDMIENAQEVIHHLTTLERLLISTKKTIDVGAWHLPSSIKSLTVSVAARTGAQIYTFLNGCSKLQYLQLQNFYSTLQLPAGHYQDLNYLRIDNCPGLTRFPIVPQGDDYLISLYDMYLVDCWELASIPNNGILAPNLVSLTLHGCNKLITLPNDMPDSLQFLSIQYCPQFKFLPRDGFPTHLQTLCIGSCDEMESLPEVMSDCTYLEFLDIENCSALVSFPTTGLPQSLQKLKIYTCVNLSSLPNRLCRNLKILNIQKCPKLISFPQVGLPPTLESLHVLDCEELLRNYAVWQLDTLVYLKDLRLAGLGDVESFPANDSLPSTLNVLAIEHFSGLKAINCSELQRIPTLRELEIERCSKLQYFSDNLPQSLCRLTISRSSLMVKRCREPDGEYAHMVSYINCLELV